MNAYADLKRFIGLKRSNFSPYVGGGLGIAYNNIDDISYRYASGVYIEGDSNIDIAWRVAAGVDYLLSKKSSIGIEYAYSDFGKVISSTSAHTSTTEVTLNEPFEMDMESQDIMLGFRYRF